MTLLTFPQLEKFMDNQKAIELIEDCRFVSDYTQSLVDIWGDYYNEHCCGILDYNEYLERVRPIKTDLNNENFKRLTQIIENLYSSERVRIDKLEPKRFSLDIKIVLYESIVFRDCLIERLEEDTIIKIGKM